MTDLVEAKPTLKGSYYKITYLWIWLRQEVFWYCKMVQFILVWVSKPTLIINIRLRWTTGDGKRKILMLHKGGTLHIFNVFLGSLLVNEVSQGSRDIKVLRSLFTDLFVGEIYNYRERYFKST